MTLPSEKGSDGSKARIVTKSRRFLSKPFVRLGSKFLYHSKSSKRETCTKTSEELSEEARIDRGLSDTSTVSTTSNLSQVSFTEHPSNIISDPEILAEIQALLPNRVQRSRWQVAYDFEHDGASLDELFRCAASAAQTNGPESLLLVKTDQGQVLGCFAIELWTQSRAGEYYGTGESFVFSIAQEPSAENRISIFNWNGNDTMIQSCSTNHIGIGASQTSVGWAFCLDETLLVGSASPSETFNITQRLTPGHSFRVIEVELICFSRLMRAGMTPTRNNGPQRSFFTSDE